MREIYEIVKQKKATIALAKELAEEFRTSLTASAIKCVQVTEEKCALVWSTGKQIDWCAKRENFRHFIPASRLGSDTLAGKLFDDRSQRELDGEIQISSWLEGENFAAGATLWEDSIYLSNYNAVLTILTLD